MDKIEALKILEQSRAEMLRHFELGQKAEQEQIEQELIEQGRIEVNVLGPSNDIEFARMKRDIKES